MFHPFAPAPARRAAAPRSWRFMLALLAAAACAPLHAGEAPHALTSRGTRTLTVSALGKGDFKTPQEAIAAAPDWNADRVTIRFTPGVYAGPIVIPRNKPNLTFSAPWPSSVLLAYNKNVFMPAGTGVPKTMAGTGVIALADGFEARQITFQNTAGDHGQAMALRLQGDRAALFNCRLIGWQDTLRVESPRAYFRDCHIEGRVDFIYGAGTAVFDRCEIESKNGGYVTAASTPAERPFGFVFANCRLISRDGVKTFLGRPWRPYASVTYLNCELGAHIRPAGWDNWRNPANEKTARYAELGSRGAGANPGQRVKWARQLGGHEAGHFTLPALLEGKDGWAPWAPKK